MRAEFLRNRRGNRGGAAVEFAIAVPMLVLMLLGATDFARVFYACVEVDNAAGTGAFCGAQNLIEAHMFTAMQQAALNDAKDLPKATATATQWCDCPNDPGTKVDCITGTCGGYGPPRVYAQTQVQNSFNTIVQYAGIPAEPIGLSQTAHMRVQ